MDDLPPWLVNTIALIIGAISALGVARIKAVASIRGDNSDDRSEFTAQVLARLEHVEKMVIAERRDCNKKIAQIDQHYKSRLEARDTVITELRNEVNLLRKIVEQHYHDNDRP